MAVFQHLIVALTFTQKFYEFKSASIYFSTPYLDVAKLIQLRGFA